MDKALKDSENYTARTWRVYSNAVSAIETAMENADNTSVADVEKLLADLEAAKSALVYNPSAMEECMLAVQAENDLSMQQINLSIQKSLGIILLRQKKQWNS